MATKTAQINIDVDDKSLQELNQEISELESSVQGLVVGTKEWIIQNKKLGTLKQQFSDAAFEADKLQNIVQKVGSAEQLRAVAKLGSGLVGGFAAASSAAKLFGADSEVFDEMTAKATSLMAVMGGLNQVADLFAKETLTGLKSLGKGFGTLVRTVKTASTGMKTALISTGIGALVIGVGLLIANFDKLAALVSRDAAKQKKAAEDNLKIAEKEQKITIENSKIRRTELAIQDKLNTSNSEAFELAFKEYELAKLAIDDLYSEKLRLAAELGDLEQDQAVLENKRQGKKTKAALEEKNAAIEVVKAKQLSLDTDLELLQAQARLANAQKLNVGWVDQINNEIERLQNNIVELNAGQNNSLEIYEAQNALLTEQIKLIQSQIDENGDISDSDKKRITALKAQQKALKTQNEIRKFQLSIDIDMLNSEIARNRIIDEYNQKIYESTIEIERQSQEEARRSRILENNSELIALDLQGLRDGQALRDSIVNFDLKRNKILKNRLVELYPSELKVTQEIYSKIKNFLDAYTDESGYESLEFFAAKVKELTDDNKKNLQFQAGLNKEYEKRNKFGKQLIDDAAQELALVEISTDLVIKSLDKQISSTEKQKKESEGLEKTYSQITEDLLAQQDVIRENLEAEKENLPGKNAEEQYAILQRINQLENDDAAIQLEINSTNSQITTELVRQEDLTNSLSDLAYQRLEATEAVDVAQRKIADALEDQLRLSQQLQDFTTKYAEEIQISSEVLASSMNLISTLFGEKATRAQREIDTMLKLYDELAEEEADAQDRRLGYEDELKDANGERYDELLALIAEEEAAEQAAKDKKDVIDADIDKKEKERQDAARAQARWEKANAIIQAVIATALAVIKALPNVFLSVATGVLGGIGIATIAAQKVPPAEEFEEGGFTAKAASNSTPVGVVHANEYVAPANVVNSAEGSMHVAALEAMRLRGYAEGGLATPDVSGIGQDMIDYDRLISGIAEAYQLLPRPEVSVVKITASQREVEVTKQGAGLDR